MTYEQQRAFVKSCNRLIKSVENETLDDPEIAFTLTDLGGDPATIRRLTSPGGNQATLVLYFAALLGRHVAEQ